MRKLFPPAGEGVWVRARMKNQKNWIEQKVTEYLRLLKWLANKN